MVWQCQNPPRPWDQIRAANCRHLRPAWPNQDHAIVPGDRRAMIRSMARRSRRLHSRLLHWERIWEQNIVKTMRTSATGWNRLDGRTTIDLQL